MLSFEEYKQNYKRGLQSKLIEQALVYLKLREHGCPRQKALVFAKKKPMAIDSTRLKDGPAGYQKLIPQKSSGQKINGWLKGQKLRYRGLRGFSQQTRKKQSKNSFNIATINKQDRLEFQEFRLRLKEKKIPFINSQEPKQFTQQIGYLKDQFLKDRQKRNLFLSVNGFRLDQHTRSYFQTIEQEDPNSLVVKLAAFDNPINDQEVSLQTDMEISKGRSLSAYEVQGENKRKQVINFRKTLSNFKIKNQNQCNDDKIFIKTIRRAGSEFLHASLGKSQSQRTIRGKSEIKQFYENIDKVAKLKSKGVQLNCVSNSVQNKN